MTDEEFNELHDGDLIKNNESGLAYIVIGRDEYGVIAIRRVFAGNPKNWTLVTKSVVVTKP